jgi:hypothetical protein
MSSEEAAAEITPNSGQIVSQSIRANSLDFLRSGFFGPVAGLLMWANMENTTEVRTCFYTFYAPVVLAWTSTPLGSAIEWYVDYWTHLAMRHR